MNIPSNLEVFIQKIHNFLPRFKEELIENKILLEQCNKQLQLGQDHGVNAQGALVVDTAEGTQDVYSGDASLRCCD